MDCTQLFQQSIAHIRRTVCGLGLCLVFGLMVGCAQTGQYTSKDITTLPCEQKANEFFFPLEFDEAGNQVYADQAPAIEKALHHAERVYVFVHGWNKTQKLAEGDYQDLICRFYTHSKHDSANAKRSIIIGVFWPSADFPPLLNFWRMKSRADELALTGFQSLIKLLANPAIESGGHYDLVLIGHSFGGRIILRGISQYVAHLTPEKYRFLSSLNQLQIVLLTTAMGEYILTPFLARTVTGDPLEFKREWDSQTFLQEMVQQYGRKFTRKDLLLDVLQLRLQWHPTLVQLSGLTDFRVYNIFSTHDNANRFLYPIGSFMELGGPTCAIGACGVSQWPKLVSATPAGSLGAGVDLAQSNLWNVDASEVIFSHTDIYKGRIANLVWELIALPRPQYAEIVMPKSTTLDDGKLAVHTDPQGAKSEMPTSYGESTTYSLGYRSFYEFQGRENRHAMEGVNYFRRLGETGLKAVNQLNALAFAVDNELRKGNWVAAEQGIREIARLEYFYPGWTIKWGMGFIEKGLLFDFSAVRAEWLPLNEVSYNLLLAYVLVKQGKCDEAGQVAKMVRGGITNSTTFTEGFLTSRNALWSSLWNFPGDNFQPMRIRMLNCQGASE